MRVLPFQEARGVALWRQKLKDDRLTQNAKLRQRAVGHCELARLLAGEHVAQRRIAFRSLLVVQHSVPVAEGATLAVLPAQAHMVACNDKGGC